MHVDYVTEIYQYIQIDRSKEREREGGEREERERGEIERREREERRELFK